MKKIYSTSLLLFALVQLNAQVVYTDIVDVTITSPGINTTYNVDLDGNTTDFTLAATGSMNNGGTGVQGGSAGNPLNGVLDASGDLRNVPFNTMIDANSTSWNSFPSDVPASAFLVNMPFLTEYSTLSGYIGCKFVIGTSVHYGWVGITVDTFSVSLTIHDYAYESTAGVGILAGDNGLTTGISAANNIPVRVFAANKTLTVQNPTAANLELDILNLSGQLVQSEKVNRNNSRLDVGNLVSGIYIVSIRDVDNKSLIHKKIVIN